MAATRMTNVTNAVKICSNRLDRGDRTCELKIYAQIFRGEKRAKKPTGLASQNQVSPQE